MTLLKKILGADNGEEEMEGLSIGQKQRRRNETAERRNDKIKEKKFIKKKKNNKREKGRLKEN